MSIDDLRSIAEPVLDTDVCLIGSGPAGWAAAEELQDSSLRVLMLESGGQWTDPRADALNEIEDTGTPLWNGRARVLGGTSRLWNGRCIPFDDIDFETRPWVPKSGWPFGPEAIASYVNRAAEHLGAGPYYQTDGRRAVQDGSHAQPKVDPALLLSTWWENPGQIDFGRVLVRRRSANLRVLVNATVTHLTTDRYGRKIESVEVADADGRRVTVRSRVVVLCAGGIENARILLYSNRLRPAGVGNAHDLVGRYLTDHPRDPELTARVDVCDADRFRELFGPRRVVDARSRRDLSYGFVLSPQLQRAEGLLNAAAWPHWITSNDDPFRAMKRLAKGPRDRFSRDARLVASHPGLVLRGLHARYVTRKSIKRKVARIGFFISSEQAPDPDSRVELSLRQDRLGLPIAKVNWRVGELEAKSQAVLAQAIATEFARLGLPAVHAADWAKHDRFSDAKFVDGCHPSGTTRMAADHRDGVVDADCQVHGVDSLYVAGSSVFPTGGHANPTLMIVALAIRLAQHVKTRFATVDFRRGVVRVAS